MSAVPKLDALAIARRVISEQVKPGRIPRSAYAVSMLGLAAVCEALVDATDNPQPVISTALAEAARDMIVAEADHQMAKGPEGYAPLKVGLARELAFHTFKTLFEQEFPNV